MNATSGGVCVDNVASYTCSCRNGYNGNGVVLGATVGAEAGTHCNGK